MSRGSLRRGAQLLRDLLDVVQSGRADFTAILVYDVSRWGRFQDADESAYYEFVCKQAGIAVHYCAEQFENDGSPITAIVKSDIFRMNQKAAAVSTARAAR